MSDNYRIENDMLGSVQIPREKLFGVHTVRALGNFNIAGRKVNERMIRAYGLVKLACIRVNKDLQVWDDAAKPEALEKAAVEMSEGVLSASIVVDALQGGAGTSLNMNVNEVLANRALEFLDQEPGNYTVVSPLDDVNRHQSTNDTFPTALKVAGIQSLGELEAELVALGEIFQEKEKEFSNVVKVGRTQYQDAVLTTLGREFSAYAEAVNRDRWRVYKCVERLRVIALGGTAIGSGLAAPRQYIFRVSDMLREITGLGLARAENMVEAIQNTDVFAEVSGILKACATNLLKISSDLRLLSSGPQAGIGEIRLPALQAGSSIMPAKVNPVIPETVSQGAMLVMGNDQIIAQAVSSGSLELNPFLPLIADKFLESLDVLTRSVSALKNKCVGGITVNSEKCRENIEVSTAVVTALLGRLNYSECSEIAQKSAQNGKTIRDVAVNDGYLSMDEFESLLTPEAVCRLGMPAKRKK